VNVGPEESPLLRLLLFAFFPFLAGALVLLHLAPDFVLGVAHCPLRETTGVPCPTCGGTLAAVHLASGQWAAALRANPLVTVLVTGYVPAACYACAATVVPIWRRSLRLTAKEKRTARWLAILLLAVDWLWLAARYLT